MYVYTYRFICMHIYMYIYTNIHIHVHEGDEGAAGAKDHVPTCFFFLQDLRGTRSCAEGQLKHQALKMQSLELQALERHAIKMQVLLKTTVSQGPSTQAAAVAAHQGL